MTKTRVLAGRQVFPVALGCMNLSHAYGRAYGEAASIQFLNDALDAGIDCLDTAAIYGDGENERLLSKAVMSRRDEFFLCSKCVLSIVDGKRGLNGRPEVITATLDGALQRLGTEHIDLYYMHRLDPTVPVEESVGALADAKAAGKIGAIGLSEMSADTLRRAHTEHPIAAMQSEYSPMVRNPEIAVLEACKELDVAFVAFSPVSRGLLSEAVTEEAYGEGDIRAKMPRFREPQLSHNLKTITLFNALARDNGYTPAQLAIAWVLAEDEHVIALPGTRSLEHLKEDMSGAAVTLDPDLRAEASALFEGDAIRGARYAKWMQDMVTTELFEGEELA
ncbi:MAG: aldo/keto reductase [Pseudomonadota bacterium]